MEIDGAKILDTYAEAFPTWIARIIVTAASERWATAAAVEATGFATSRIGCPCEAGIERSLTAEQTPDGRPGVAILVCSEKKHLRENVAARIGQCILPAPTASAFDGLPDAPSRFHTRMHYFGDAYEERCRVGGRSCWRIPVMEGAYVGEERFGIVKGIAGGNILVMGGDRASALAGAEEAVDAVAGLGGVVTSFAGGVVGSGSKVGCRNYRFPMPASTNHAWCPALKNVIDDSQVPPGVESVYEVVVNGIDEEAVRAAMKAGILAAAGTGRVLAIGASNFEGKLGPHRLHLLDLFR